MDLLMKLVTTALELSYAEARTDVTASALESAAQLLMLTQDNIPLIDAPASKQAQTTSKEETLGQSSAHRPKKRGRAKEGQPDTSSAPLSEPSG